MSATTAGEYYGYYNKLPSGYWWPISAVAAGICSIAYLHFVIVLAPALGVDLKWHGAIVVYVAVALYTSAAHYGILRFFKVLDGGVDIPCVYKAAGLQALWFIIGVVLLTSGYISLLLFLLKTNAFGLAVACALDWAGRRQRTRKLKRMYGR